MKKVVVLDGGIEVKGIKKLKYLTLSDIAEAYFLIPINDFIVNFLKRLDKILWNFERLRKKWDSSSD